MRRRSIEERFWEKVAKTSDCWLWIAGTSKGRGKIWMNGKKRQVHRVSWEMAHGPVPDGLNVCHHCDTPRCVRPDHLFLGTQLDNIRDMDAKGRRVTIRGPSPRSGKRGEDHYLAKLNRESILSIVEAFRGGESRSSLGRRFGVDPSTIRSILLGITWKSVTEIGETTNA